jgi:hypothetical protein
MHAARVDQRTHIIQFLAFGIGGADDVYPLHSAVDPRIEMTRAVLRLFRQHDGM